MQSVPENLCFNTTSLHLDLIMFKALCVEFSSSIGLYKNGVDP